MAARVHLLVLAFILHLVAAPPASLAHIVVYGTTMSGAAEFPPNGSLGTGVSTVTINDHDFSMRVEASFSGLTGTTTIAHIHAATTIAGTGTAGVATALPTFPGFPAGVTSGTYDQTFDMTQAASWNPAFVTANGGTTGAAFSALLAALNDGKAYFNVHTSFVGGGEIRGFYALVPEPSGLAFALIGGVLAMRHRRTGRIALARE
ncbi:MAG: CHRD domain-containing protein [Tepidisphaeraceae bacterium]